MPLQPITKVKQLKGKRVLVRVDFNVPVHKGKIVEDFKIRRSLATIRYLMEQGAQIILVSHLGRPKGFDKKLTLEPVAKHLERLLRTKVIFQKIKRLEDLKTVKKTIEELNEGAIVVLENIRFLPNEEKNDKKLAQALVDLADVFVLDGFAVAHRDAASVTGVAKLLPAYAGLLLFEEVNVLSQVLQKPKRPLVAVLGGAKVETKIPVLKNVLRIADYILVSGGIANTYFWAKGYKVGGSLIGKEYKKEMLEYCSKKKVILPVDVVVGGRGGERARLVPVEALAIKNKNEAIYDVGPATILLFSEYLKNAETIIWNGALGMFEQHPYEYGTYALAQLFAARAKGEAFGVAGGGETVEILQQLGALDQVDLVSTGGGAMMDFLAGEKLPGIAALQK